jgi:DNA polymerase elongation subunit (family B)
VIGKQSGSKQTGSFVSNEVTILGRVVMDMFSVIRRARPNLKRFTLNAVSKSLLGEQKEDVPPHMIAKLQDGTAATRHRLGVYCVRDSVLPLRLMDKLMLLIQLIEQARLCFVPIEFILTRGQQVKVVTLIYRFAAEEGMFVDWIPHDGADDGGKGFEGAIVIPPVAGFYDVPVVTLDFMSLYPSIMMAHNLCFTTLAKPAKRALIAPEKLATTPAGVTFVRDEYEVVENGETVTKPGHKGLLPSILARLLDARRAAKRDMAAAAAAGDVVRESIYNAKQLALKVVCNSVYGFTGARRGKLPCLEISGSVTAYGRDMINLTRTKIEERYCRKNGFSCDAKVIYGDSVTEDTPILVRRGQAIEIVRIDEMAEGGWSPWHRTKEAADCRLEVWTDQGWTNVKRVIRHTIPAEKHIIEVLTPTGVVKVTDEHSLLRPDGSMVDAKDVEVGTPLLHAICPESPCIETVSTNEAWQMGLFFADETAVEIADFYQPLFYDSSGNKRVPPFILSGPYAVRRAFFEGYYAGDGHKDNSGFVQCVVKGQIGAAGLFQIMSSIGYQVGIDTREDAHDIYCLAAIRAAECPWENPSVIKKIREVKHGVIFVFDLQTDNGHFSAGSGRLVGHNTDSVMIRINDKKMTMAEVMAFGREAAEYVTRFFRRPIKLEFEKVYNPYLLMKKKRYAGLYWTKPDKPDFLDKKGVESKRRGYPLFTEQAVDAVFELIIRQRDPAAAMAHALAQLQVLLDGEVGMDHLKINCGLTRDSKDFKKTVGTQNQLRDRMLERARRGEMALNDVPDIGDRIDYVMVAVGQRKNGKWLGAAAQRAEDPTYAFEHGLPLDYAWYAEKRYVDVMARILSFVDPDALRKLKAVTPRHVRARGVASGALAAFVRAGQTCAGCNARIMGAKRTPALCDRCRPSAGVLLMVRMAEVERLQAEQAALSGTCHRCQGDSFRPVTCSNNTCAIFYKRFETERACTDAERRMRQDFGELF